MVVQSGALSLQHAKLEKQQNFQQAIVGVCIVSLCEEAHAG